ncbi:DUF1007 family protein [Roseibium sp.]|uniref:HoxN/HupN/NixA family nickel/cobalt transporter n=1 Tax=Roseibium sp. TaxID=1936156 RepID=UPI003BAE818D
MRSLIACSRNAVAFALRRAALGLLVLVATLTGLAAHPHVFVEARSKLVFDDDGNAVAVQHIFRFDDAFTAFAIQGFDTNNDGVYSREELSELADVNIESMADFGYFTFGDNTRIELDFETPTDYWLEVATVPIQDYWVMKPEDFEAMREDVQMNGGSMIEDVDLLELHFTLPLKDASDADNAITLDVYDPTYYVDFRFGQEDGALGTVNAPAACQITRREPPPLDDATAYALAQIGPDQRDLPPELQSAAASQINQMIVTCGGATTTASAGDGVAAPETTTSVAAIENALQFPADTGTGTSESRAEDVVAGAQQDVLVIDGQGQPEIQVGVLDSVFGTIAVKQKEFYQSLVASLRSFRSDPNAFWLLVGLSFAYGIFHAAGPGHGKAVITLYVVANNETLKKGIVLSFAAAFAQALTAIVLVGGLAIVLKQTSIVVQDSAEWLEVGSYALITVLGAWLLWLKAFKPLTSALIARLSSNQLALAGAGHGHHDHGHGHHHHGHGHHHHEIGPDGVCSTCGHAHAPTPEMLQGKITPKRAVAIVLAVGLRPCTGALVVLVFALSQGMVAAGIASTLVMAVGTGITVSLLAALAVGAKDLAVRLFGEGSPMANLVHRTIEIVAALVIFLFGLILLIAAVGWR